MFTLYKFSFSLCFSRTLLALFYTVIQLDYKVNKCVNSHLVTSQNCLGNNLNLIPFHVWVIDKRIFSIKQILRNKQILICFKCSIYSFIQLPKIKIRFSNGRRKHSLHIKGYFLVFCNVIQKRLGFRMNNCSGFYYHSFSADLTKHTVLFDTWCVSYFLSAQSQFVPGK